MAANVRELLSLQRPSDFVLKTMTKTNLDTIGYESIFLSWLCALIAAITFLPIPPWSEQPGHAVAVLRAGFAAIAAVSVAFGFAIRNVRRDGKNPVLPPLLMLLFIISIMSLSMGLTLFNYGISHNFIIYVSALVLVFGLIYLPPAVTFVIVALCTVLMIGALFAMGYGNAVNVLTLTTYGLLVMVVSASGYHIRMRSTMAGEAVHDISIHDELTGTKNRRALEGDAASFAGRPIFVLLGDIDDFKFYNDLFGHATGDQMLRQFAQSMCDAFDPDHVYRYGGDEFVAVVPGTDERRFLEIVAAWREGIVDLEEKGDSYTPTTSGGYVSGTPASERDFHEMLRLADIRLYDAKQAGKNTVLGIAFDEASRASIVSDAKRMRDRRPGDSDPLTGLPSITYFYAHARTLITSPKLRDTSFCIVYFNVENMKSYNERFGMTAGDELLAFAAKAIGESFEHVLLSRFGDDRYVLLTSADGLEAGLERVYNQVLSFNDDARTIIRAGVYRYEGSLSISVACDRAKLACDHIKGHYNVHYCEYGPELLEERDLKQFILDHFDEALEKGHIQVHYQPIVRAIDRKVCDIEALARWIDPERGFISPADFIPVLEEFRLIHRLDLHIVKVLCSGYPALAAAGRTMTPMNVNFSRYDMELCDIVAETTALLQRYGVPPYMLNVEMTESTFSQDSELLRSTIERFHQAGMQVWMDDFGSGYSSLNVLREYDFDVVKMDLAFLRHRNDTSRQRSHQMLPHIISMLKDLGLQTLVEGVETQEQYQFLKDIGCEKVQGFAFAKPTPIEKLDEALREGGMQPETRATRLYQDAVGSVNLLKPAAMDQDMGHAMELSSGFPAAIVEFCGGAVRYLAWNSSYLDYLRDIGMETIENSTRQMNDTSRPQSIGFHSAAARMKGRPEWLNLTFYEGDDLCTGMARCVGVNQETDATAFVYIAFNVSSFLSKAGYNIPQEGKAS